MTTTGVINDDLITLTHIKRTRDQIEYLRPDPKREGAVTIQHFSIHRLTVVVAMDYCPQPQLFSEKRGPEESTILHYTIKVKPDQYDTILEALGFTTLNPQRKH